MELSEDSIRFVVSIYNIVFAKKLREEIVTLAAKHCYGCKVNHPSQAQHTSLMWTEFEHLDVYLEEALETVDREEVRKQWDKLRYSEKIRVEIDEHYRKSFIELLQDTEWCRTHLPKVEIIHKDVKHIMHLRRRYGFDDE
jgi:protein associated with RNAse G/E